MGFFAIVGIWFTLALGVLLVWLGIVELARFLKPKKERDIVSDNWEIM